MVICALDIQTGRSESWRLQSRAGMSSPAGVWEGALSGKSVLSPSSGPGLGRARAEIWRLGLPTLRPRAVWKGCPHGKMGMLGFSHCPHSVIPDSAPWTSGSHVCSPEADLETSFV